jgi:hypothetical protein
MQQRREHFEYRCSSKSRYYHSPALVHWSFTETDVTRQVRPDQAQEDMQCTFT